ncbi:Carbon starvation protein A [Botrimarina colliarenosi]|uniref:Carbon starvation protein A n=1 Tax=Botrimarina colliarenosi TaxID=2528001 RepID=A0A5C6AIF0_9BACT|nr:carbon starvation protein A [Botrimarina colliarenosi]TWT99832.1 Carbon starvation protein A [Botrimarina colliarenosi]
MLTIAVALGSFAALWLAYVVYGGWLSRRVFKLDPTRRTPAYTERDDLDFVPTRRSVVFGHHFTSIAGTGPIVGPAIAVFWGWLPALLWVVLGSIFVGAVHDFGSLVVSLRHRGQTIGEAAGQIISPRARVLFLIVLFFALMLVIAVFGLVIASIFDQYPESVLSVWLSLPLAVMIGLATRRTGGAGLTAMSLVSLVLLYVGVWYGTQHPIVLPAITALGDYGTPVVVWTAILLAYCFAASVMPVWLLLQPRDYVNALQLLVAMGLLVGGLVVAGLTGAADLNAAPVVATDPPADAPAILPFLFITVACGACSGFHCLVASGTTSKQLENEGDARVVGYGGMLLEGALAVVVILACCAGLGMGVPGADGEPLTGADAWRSKYQAVIIETTAADGAVSKSGGWKAMRLRQQVGAFVEGGANFVGALGLPRPLAVAVIAVLVACFAATTLDTATRLHRYVIQELAGTLHFQPLTNRYTATTLSVVGGGAMAMIPGPAGPGSGGLMLWPLFGATNQLLAGLAFIVIVVYLWRRGLPVAFAMIPGLALLAIPGWAMAEQVINDFLPARNWPLVAFGVAILVLQIWMAIEAVFVWPKARGVLEAGAEVAV